MWSTHRIQTLVNVAMIILLLFGPGTFAPVKAQEPAPAATGDPQPELLKDIYTANGSSNPGQFLANGNRVFYVASDPDHGEELWVSDGTAGGTQMVMDIYPGESDSNVSNLTLFRGQVYFSASPSMNNGEVRIYYTDGTPSGTDDVYQVEFTHFTWMGSSGDWLYFATSDYRLGRYGGPGNAVEWLLDAGVSMCLSTTDGAVMLGGDLYFAAADASGIDATYSTELWVSDGSEAGTHMVKDITDETESFYPWYDEMNRTSIGSWLYFAADDSVHGLELWRSDGTEANTALVADLAADEGSSFPEYLTAIDSGSSQTVLFAARDDELSEGHGVELWAVPVTAAGMPSNPELIEIEPGLESSFPTSLVSLGGKAYFSAFDSVGGFELWESDGTPAGTVRVVDGVPGSGGSAPRNLAVWGSSLVYSAMDALHGIEPWISSTAPGDAYMVADVVTNQEAMVLPPSAGMVTNVGGRNIRYFSAGAPLYGRELWRTDGTLAGTRLVRDIFPGPESSMPKVEAGDAVEINGILYFICNDPGSFNNAVWRTDGTAEGTWKLQPSALSQHASVIEIGAGGDTLYFIINISENFLQETQLWKSDGTRNGTEWVKTLMSFSFGSEYSDLYPLEEDVVFYFVNQLWRSNGTEAGTQPIKQFTWDDNIMDNVIVLGDRLYFSAPAPDGSGYSVLWYTDGTPEGTSQIQTAGAIPFRDPGMFTLEGNDFYFVAHKYDSGGNRLSVSLWKITAGQTTVSLVIDLIPLSPGDPSNPLFLTLLNEEKWMYLDYNSYASHRYQWYVADPATGISEPLCPEFSCYPDQVTLTAAWNGKVYFMANDLGDNYPYTMMVSDGTGAGTMAFNMPGTITPFQDAKNFLSTPNAFYFAVDDGVHGTEPWVIRAKESKIYLPLVRK